MYKTSKKSSFFIFDNKHVAEAYWASLKKNAACLL